MSNTAKQLNQLTARIEKAAAAKRAKERAARISTLEKAVEQFEGMIVRLSNCGFGEESFCVDLSYALVKAREALNALYCHPPGCPKFPKE